MQVEKVSIIDQVIRYIGENIENGNWTGKIPSENQLVEEMGVSRVSVRAGIRHYLGLGILQSIHGKGTYLISDKLDVLLKKGHQFLPEDYQDMRKTLEFRRIIEKEACYIAVTNMTEECVTELRNAYEEMRESVGQRENFVEADIKFHQILCNQSKNPLIIKCMQIVYCESKEVLYKMNDCFGCEDGLDYHLRILDAVIERDADKASKYMQEHVEKGIKRLDLI